MNVLLVVLDSVRAQNTSLLGYERETTPFLSRLAETSTVYTEARTNGRWSVPAHASMFTGLRTSEHGLRGPSSRLQSGESVFHRLRESGYRTGLFSSNGWLLSSGLDDGFGTVVSELPPFFEKAMDALDYDGSTTEFIRDAMSHDQPIRSVLNGVLTKIGWDFPELVSDSVSRGTSISRPTDAHYIDQFEEWLDDGEGPWAACLNLMDAHSPYLPDSNPWGSWGNKRLHRQWGMWELIGEGRFDLLKQFENLYDGAIRQTDRSVGRIVQMLKNRGLFEETLPVVLSDHGEGFGEQSPIRSVPVVQHLYSVSEEILHVPLLTKRPEQAESQVVDSLAMLRQLTPLIEDMVWGEGKETMRCTDGFVSGSLTANHKQSWETNTNKDPRYKGRVYVRYQNTDNGISRRIAWKDRAIELGGRRPDVASKPDILDEFNQLDKRDLTEKTSESPARQLLDDLGYL